MVTMTGTLYGVGVCFVALREEGILKRFLVTPVSLWKIVLGLCLSQMVVIGLISTSLLFITEIFFRTFPSTMVWKLILVFLLGTMMFSALALALASIARSVHEAAGITQILYGTMIILSGGPVSYEAMPGWLQKISLLFPATYYILSLREALTGNAPANIYSPLIMAAFLLLAVTVSIKYFHWERSA
jgi:ABC-type multidrug transport system permease subunit